MITDCKKPWANKETGEVDNEIAWTENYLLQLREQVTFQESRLARYKEYKAFWVRFINYCHTGE